MVSPFQLLGPQSFLDSFSDRLKHHLQVLLPHKAHVYPALRYLRFLAKGNEWASGSRAPSFYFFPLCFQKAHFHPDLVSDIPSPEAA